jgi:hypothetical protein
VFSPAAPITVRCTTARCHCCRRRTQRFGLRNTRSGHQGSRSSAPCPSLARPDGATSSPDPAATAAESHRRCTPSPSTSRASSVAPSCRRRTPLRHRRHGCWAPIPRGPPAPLQAKSLAATFVGSAHEFPAARLRRRRGGGEGGRVEAGRR